MTDFSNVPEEVKNAIRDMAQNNPDYVAKFGDPLDETDPRNWKPTERAERGVDFEARISLLELDMELNQIMIAKISAWMLDQQRKEMEAEIEADPMGFLQKIMGNLPGSYGPQDDHGPAYAGSTKGIAPETPVETPGGTIRADQIPGYRNDPSWRPSPDWVDANCTCPSHMAIREQSSHKQVTDDDGFPTGFYL